MAGTCHWMNETERRAKDNTDPVCVHLVPVLTDEVTVQYTDWLKRLKCNE